MLSMVHTAAMASAATHMADSEVFTAKDPWVLLAPMDLDLSDLLALEVPEADPALLVELDQLQVDQAPAAAAAADLHPVHPKLYFH